MTKPAQGRLRGPTRPRWTQADDFVLRTLIGKASYAQIALRLGRPESAVQKRASSLGLSQRREWQADRSTRRRQAEAVLDAPEDAYASFLAQEQGVSGLGALARY